MLHMAASNESREQHVSNIIMRIGIGYDSHRLIEGRRLIIGGVEIPHPRGLAGHSDADVLCHAVIDALLGAIGKGDIGTHFPDTDQTWENASSLDLLSRVIAITHSSGYEIQWIDSVVIAEEPRIGSFIPSMKEQMTRAGIPAGTLSIKAKTNEGMGAIGRKEGIAVQAVCLLKPA